jgi:transcriptional regulator with PAS, ATPase and Fis domain
MFAEELRLDEIIEFSEGNLNLQGRRLVLHDLHAFAELRRDLFEMLGQERARQILTRFGFYWGKADASAMDRIFKWENITEWIKAGPRMHTLQGITKAVIKSLEVVESSGHFNMELIWYNSGEAEEHLIAKGQSNYPVCWKLVGYASGYASHCFGKEIYFIENKCKARGDHICTVVGKDKDSWGKDIRPYLPFFQIDDVQGKIDKLTKELRKKSRKIAEQRKKIELISDLNKDFTITVKSKSFQRILELANRVAPYDSSILITGETGVGKEVMGRYIHGLSLRSKGVFSPINCGALPEALLESELFGHKAGSFTGAIKDRIGILEGAKGGTILLDEIGDISSSLQVKLLRVLQEREIIRVGENTPRKIDVRLISATNRNLPQLIEEGKFREDLYYRLGVIEIEIPSLRDRIEDILPLTRYFIDKFSKKLKKPNLQIDASCINYLQDYSWPGNIRELENTIERSALLCIDDHIFPENLPPRIVKYTTHSSLRKDLSKATLSEVEQQHIEHVMNLTNGNQTKSAKILGISLTTLWRKLKHK